MRTLLFVAAALCTPALVCAQTQPTGAPHPSQPSLRVPLVVFGAAASADWATTYRNLRESGTERNPLFKGMQNLPKTLVLTGAAFDVGCAWAWTKATKKHRKIARAGLYIAAAYRIGLAIHNTVEFNRVRHR